MEKFFQVSNLLEFYGDLLTDTQKQILDLYYNEDLSLSEIALNRGISRQGVRDIIKRAETQLFDFEEKLHLFKKFTDLKSCFSQIVELSLELENLATEGSDVYKLSNMIKHVANNACDM